MVLAADTIDQITWVLGSTAGRRHVVAGYRNYYEGEQRLRFTNERLKSTFYTLFDRMRDNLCAGVVDALTDRLQITGFHPHDLPDGEDPANHPMTSIANEVWRRNKMAIRSGDIHKETVITGDGFVVVWPDADGMPRIFPQWSDQICVDYDEEDPDRIVRAGKVWRAGGLYRVTLYFPDRIEKYAVEAKEIPTTGERFDVFEVEGELWPLPNQYGVVPVFHFANNSGLGDYGRSELKDIIPLQDALNKTIVDMLVGNEFVAYPQRWVTGLEVELDDEGRPRSKPFEPGIDRMFTTASPDAKFGQFDPASVDQFIRQHDSLRAAISRVSKTPLHVLMLASDRDYPSGEALKTAESPFVRKVEDRQITFGDVWEQVISFCLRIRNQAVDVEPECDWTNPAPRAELEEVQIAEIKSRLGISKRKLQQELGYSDAEIEAMANEVTMEAQSMADALGSTMIDAFNSGDLA